MYVNETLYHTACVQPYMSECLNCRSRHFTESDQIEFVSWKSIQTWICAVCLELSSQRLNYRSWTATTIGKGQGTIVRSTRGWSAEIECYITNIGKINSAFAKLPDTFGINRDGSLEAKSGGSEGKKLSDGRRLVKGMELTTPVLRGTEGETYLKNICDALNADDTAKVDHTCGLHLHIDMSDIRYNHEAIKNLMAFHWIYEGVIKSFLPGTRRLNIFCQSTRNDYSLTGIARAENIQKLATLWYKKRRDLSHYNKKHPRYHGINFHSFFTDGHVEIRYHSGTTNLKKILAWASLHVAIIDYCAGLKNAITVDEIIRANTTLTKKPRTLSTLTKKLFEAIDLPTEVREYFLSRQKKFKDSPQITEAEYLEQEKRLDAKDSDQATTTATVDLSTVVMN